MTRDTMASAIRMGLRRGAGKDPEGQAMSVLDAIEMAMELELSMNGDIPATAKSSASPVLDSSPPPPNPDAMQESAAVDIQPSDVTHPRSPVRVNAPVSATNSPVSSPPPPPADQGNLVVLASTDAEIDQAVRDAKVSTDPKRPRVRSVFMRGGTPKIKLEDVMGWIVANFPQRISVVPHGMDRAVVLERKVYSIPCTVDNKESVAKVSYNHMKMDSRGEVGLGIRVGDVVTQGYPVMEDVLALIKEQAIEMYKNRPAMIEGRAPTGPDLYGAYRQMPTDPRKRSTAPPMKFADADDAPMFPENG